MSLVDKVTTGTNSFAPLIVKIILLALSLLLISFSLPAQGKTQYFVHLSFVSIFQLINGILNDLQRLLKYFNRTAIIAFFRIPLAPLSTVFPINLALYLKELKCSMFSILVLKIVLSSFE